MPSFGFSITEEICFYFRLARHHQIHLLFSAQQSFSTGNGNKFIWQAQSGRTKSFLWMLMLKLCILALHI
jgi:hypothetical protein